MLLGFALGGLLYRVFVELLVAGCLAGLVVNINGVCAVDEPVAVDGEGAEHRLVGLRGNGGILEDRLHGVLVNTVALCAGGVGQDMNRALGIERVGYLLALVVLGDVLGGLNFVVLDLIGTQIHVVVAVDDNVDIKAVYYGQQALAHDDGVGLVYVLARGIAGAVHEDYLPLRVRRVHVVLKPVYLLLADGIHIVCVEHGDMCVRVVERIVDAGDMIPACALVEVEHIVEPAPTKVALVVAGGRRHGDVHECVAALLIEPVPFLIVAVVDEVARVHEKLRVGADLHRGALNGAALREVYFVARLNIGKGYERKRLFAVAGCLKCAVVAPDAGRSVADSVNILCAGLKIFGEHLVAVVLFPLRAGAGKFERAVEAAVVFCKGHYFNIAAAFLGRVPADAASCFGVAVDNNADALYRSVCALLRHGGGGGDYHASEQADCHDRADYPHQFFVHRIFLPNFWYSYSTSDSHKSQAS